MDEGGKLDSSLPKKLALVQGGRGEDGNVRGEKGCDVIGERK